MYHNLWCKAWYLLWPIQLQPEEYACQLSQPNPRVAQELCCLVSIVPLLCLSTYSYSFWLVGSYDNNQFYLGVCWSLKDLQSLRLALCSPLQFMQRGGDWNYDCSCILSPHVDISIWSVLWPRVVFKANKTGYILLMCDGQSLFTGTTP